MKFKILISFLIINYGYSQDYTHVDNLVKRYPNSLNSIDAIGKQILKDFTTDEDKVKAAFTWTAINIEYNVYETNPFRTSSEIITYYSEYDLKRVLQKKFVRK